MRISDWSSDVCSSDLGRPARPPPGPPSARPGRRPARRTCAWPPVRPAAPKARSGGQRRGHGGPLLRPNAILLTPRPPDPLCCVAAPQTGDPMLLYQMHELGRAWMAPFTYWADANARMFSAGDRWLSSIPGASRISAGNELLHRIGKDYEKPAFGIPAVEVRSEEHTSELQSLMRNSYAVFCLKKKKQKVAQS